MENRIIKRAGSCCGILSRDIESFLYGDRRFVNFDCLFRKKIRNFGDFFSLLSKFTPKIRPKSRSFSLQILYRLKIAD